MHVWWTGVSSCVMVLAFEASRADAGCNGCRSKKRSSLHSTWNSDDSYCAYYCCPGGDWAQLFSSGTLHLTPHTPIIKVLKVKTENCYLKICDCELISSTRRKLHCCLQTSAHISSAWKWTIAEKRSLQPAQLSKGQAICWIMLPTWVCNIEAHTGIHFACNHSKTHAAWFYSSLE